VKSRKKRDSKDGKVFLANIGNLVHLCVCSANALCQCFPVKNEGDENETTIQTIQKATKGSFNGTKENAKVYP
jgi:hypothetical protein